MERIVLACSDDFETATAIPRLRSARGGEVIAVILDLGQGRELESIRQSALAAGAARAHVLDVRAEFAHDYMLRALKAGAAHRDGLLTTRALVRPLVARKLVDMAGIERATAVAYGDARAADGAASLQPLVTALDPGLELISVPCDPEPSAAPGAGTHPKPVAEYASEPAYVDITFDRGAPTSINGIEMPMLDLLDSLSTIARAHGIGSDGDAAADAAAIVVLQAAHQELQRTLTTTDTDRVCRTLSAQYADVVANGLWFNPERKALDACIDEVQERVSGVVRLQLFNGGCRIVDTQSDPGRSGAMLLVPASQ